MGRAILIAKNIRLIGQPGVLSLRAAIRYFNADFLEIQELPFYGEHLTWPTKKGGLWPKMWVAKWPT